MEDNFTGGSGIWLFALLILFGMGGGFGYGNANAGRYATVEDINNSANFTRLESQVRDNANLTERKVDGIANGLSSLGYDVAGKFCTISKEILDSRYQTAGTVTDATAKVLAGQQKILDAITGNRMADMQNQINALQLQNAMCGVVRYPNGMVYTAGTSPFCNCNCGAI